MHDEAYFAKLDEVQSMEDVHWSIGDQRALYEVNIDPMSIAPSYVFKPGAVLYVNILEG